MRKSAFCLLLSFALGCQTPSAPPAPSVSPTAATPVAAATATATPTPQASPVVDTTHWHEFVAPDKSFKVMLPGKEDVDHSSRDHEDGYTVEHYAVITVLDDNTYELEWRDYPDEEKAVAFYEQHNKDIREEAGELLLEEKTVHLDSHEGIRFKFNDPEKEDTFYEAAFRVGPRFFSVLIVHKNDANAGHHHAEAVVGTFKFLE